MTTSPPDSPPTLPAALDDPALTTKIARGERLHRLSRRYLLTSGVMLGLLLVVNLVLFRMDGVDLVFFAGLLVCGICVAYQFYGRTMRILGILWIALTLPFWYLAGWLAWQMFLALNSDPPPERPFRDPAELNAGALINLDSLPYFEGGRLQVLALEMERYLVEGEKFEVGRPMHRYSPSAVTDEQIRQELYPELDIYFEAMGVAGPRDWAGGGSIRIPESIRNAELGRIAKTYRAGHHDEAATLLTRLFQVYSQRLVWAENIYAFRVMSLDLELLQHFLYQVCPDLLITESQQMEAAIAGMKASARQAQRRAMGLSYDEFAELLEELGRSYDFPDLDFILLFDGAAARAFPQELAWWAIANCNRRWSHWPVRDNVLWRAHGDLQALERNLPAAPRLAGSPSPLAPHFSNANMGLPGLDKVINSMYLQERVEYLLLNVSSLESRAAAHAIIAGWYADPASLSAARLKHEPMQDEPYLLMEHHATATTGTLPSVVSTPEHSLLVAWGDKLALRHYSQFDREILGTISSTWPAAATASPPLSAYRYAFLIKRSPDSGAAAAPPP